MRWHYRNISWTKRAISPGVSRNSPIILDHTCGLWPPSPTLTWYNPKYIYRRGWSGTHYSERETPIQRLCYVSLKRQQTFGDATTGFPAKWRLRNERRNSILMTCHYPDLGSASDWLNQISHAARPIRSTTQIWVKTHHQYRISALDSQTRFLTLEVLYGLFSLRANLVPRFSLLPISLSRFAGTGRREPWERGCLRAGSSEFQSLTVLK